MLTESPVRNGGVIFCPDIPMLAEFGGYMVINDNFLATHGTPQNCLQFCLQLGLFSVSFGFYPKAETL